MLVIRNLNLISVQSWRYLESYETAFISTVDFMCMTSQNRKK